MTAEKIKNLEQAVRWRRTTSGTVVFTNGVFDILHPGHVGVLEAARYEGDALIVGVNDDPSAQRLGKGPDRPLNHAQQRARLVAALECVDCVVIFGEDTPLDLIQALEPDVLVKGGDYTDEEMIGRDFVLRRGGRVKIVPLEDGYSTTALVERIRGQTGRKK